MGKNKLTDTEIIYSFTDMSIAAEGQIMSLKEFLREIREFGLKIAFGNFLICFTKWYVKAKKIQLTYGKK